MPLLKPSNGAIAILQEAGVIPTPSDRKDSIKKVLNDRGLDRDRLVDELATDLNSTDEKIHHSAVQLGFKLHGDLSDKQENVVPVINITISGIGGKIHPILIPREVIDVHAEQGV